MALTKNIAVNILVHPSFRKCAFVQISKIKCPE